MGRGFQDVAAAAFFFIQGNWQHICAQKQRTIFHISLNTVKKEAQFILQRHRNFDIRNFILDFLLKFV
jgi:hypothetical protein